jgi:hypothetical protein
VTSANYFALREFSGGAGVKTGYGTCARCGSGRIPA